MLKNILFVSGTRADFGKQKQLVEAAAANGGFNAHLLMMGMHLERRFGFTYVEGQKLDGVKVHLGKSLTEDAKTDFGKCHDIVDELIREEAIDILVVHGDRLEALASSIAALRNNVFIIHIEGGEKSGTMDESIRHAVSKLANLHLVANKRAAARLRQMGEDPSSIIVFGSLDIHVMKTADLPSLDSVRSRYEIPFTSYAIVSFHPVTTDEDECLQLSSQLSNLLQFEENFIVIRSNNDLYHEYFDSIIDQNINRENIRVFPSVRFEAFLVLLKNSKFIIGNSSSLIRESPVFGVPSFNIGTRQLGRDEFQTPSITHMPANHLVSSDDINKVLSSGKCRESSSAFSEEDCISVFNRVLEQVSKSKLFNSKIFMDLDFVQ